jgi:hypothetical protein
MNCKTHGRTKTTGPWLRGTVTGLILVLAASSLTAAHAADDLDKELAVVAKGIKQLLDGRNEDSIAIGEFTGSARVNASGGAGIKLALTRQLEKLGVRVGRKAELEVKGDFLDVEDSQTKLTALRLKARVIDRGGAEITHFDRGLFNATTIASLIGLTAAIPPSATDKERNEKLTEAIDDPKVNLAGTRITAAADSPYALEVLVKSGDDYRPRAATKDGDGFAFLRIRRDEIYAVRLINDSAFDAAVTLTIDGLSVFAFSETPNYTHWIVPPKKSLTVVGWHRTNQVSDSFLVTEYAKSAAAEKLPGSTTIGTITACFAAAWPQGSTPPPDEPTPPPGGRSADATGKGPPVKTNFEEVTREIGRLRASVSVRYNKDQDPKDLPTSKNP